MSDMTGLPPIDVSAMQPNEALTALLANAQKDHRACLRAVKDDENVIDKCAMTWGEVHHRYRQWAAYRAPFKNEAAEAKHGKFWNKKRLDWDDNRMF
jgi:hypothetical protein